MVEHVGFRLGQQLITLFGIESAVGFIQHLNVFRILPACAALAGCVEKTQETVRVHVIGAERSARKSFVFKFGAFLQKSLPLHISQANSNAEVLFPLSLHPFGYRLICCLAVVIKLDLVHWKLWTRKTAVRVLHYRVTGLAE